MDRVRKRRSRFPCIYFIQRGDGQIKIGFTTRLKGRLAWLRRKHGPKVRLLGIKPGSRKREAFLQDHFGHLNVQGEWFRPGADLLEYIKAHTFPDRAEMFASLGRTDYTLATFDCWRRREAARRAADEWDREIRWLYKSAASKFGDEAALLLYGGDGDHGEDYSPDHPILRTLYLAHSLFGSVDDVGGFAEYASRFSDERRAEMAEDLRQVLALFEHIREGLRSLLDETDSSAG